MNTNLFSLDLKLSFEKETILIIGKFETFHLGHQKIILEAKKYALINNLEIIILIYKLDNFKSSIFSLKDRLNLISLFGINNVIIFEPTPENFKISISDFVDWAKHNLNARIIFSGNDLTFHKTENDLEIFKNLIEVKTFSLEKIQNVKISSQTIHLFLRNSEIKEVNIFLGFNYFYSGRIISGNQMGSKIGFPTANLKLSNEVIYPGMGIYYSYFIWNNQKYPSLTSIYTNDTINENSKEIFLETYILNFDQIIYGEIVKIELVELLRFPKKYPSIINLQKAINDDVKKALKFFKK